MTLAWTDLYPDELFALDLLASGDQSGMNAEITIELAKLGLVTDRMAGARLTQAGLGLLVSRGLAPRP